jgi:hypothetical protein
VKLHTDSVYQIHLVTDKIPQSFKYEMHSEIVLLLKPVSLIKRVLVQTTLAIIISNVSNHPKDA